VRGRLKMDEVRVGCITADFAPCATGGYGRTLSIAVIVIADGGRVHSGRRDLWLQWYFFTLPPMPLKLLRNIVLPY